MMATVKSLGSPHQAPMLLRKKAYAISQSRSVWGFLSTAFGADRSIQAIEALASSRAEDSVPQLCEHV